MDGIFIDFIVRLFERMVPCASVILGWEDDWIYLPMLYVMISSHSVPLSSL